VLPFETWQRCCPLPGGLGPLAGIGALLASIETRAELARCEAEERFPDELVARLDRLGVPLLFAAAPDAPYTTAQHVSALNAIAAQASGSLAVSLGITGLALLPLYIAGTGEQLARVRERVLGGAKAAMLLSEWSHGSDLAAGETRAEREEGGYRLTGEKQLINMGRRAELLTTLARTSERPAGGVAAAGGLSLFLVERDHTVDALPRWRTLPVPAADIGGARFRGTRVPAANRIGGEGDGFRLVQAALSISRGGISAFASGTASRACGLAFAHARRRVLYGQPIARLGAVADHLARMAALDLATGCVSAAAALASNALGQRAGHVTAVAKLAACDLAERTVGQGRAVLSARALLSDLTYQQVVRDAMLYGVFDGTRHIMLDHIQRRVQQMCRPGAGGEEIDRAAIHRAPPAPLVESSRVRGRAWLPRPSATAAALAGRAGAVDLGPVVDGARALEAAAAALPAEAWSEQPLAFALAENWALLDAALAAAELGDPARRAALGLPPAGPAPLDAGALARLAVAQVAREALSGARAALAGCAVPLAADAAERALAAEEARAARLVREAIQDGA
jgi:alkylation response protein AidB-like acyl-CoA dehydrogenase